MQPLLRLVRQLVSPIQFFTSLAEGFLKKTFIFEIKLDTEIGRIFKACQENNYILMVTSDHGNAEKMIEEDGSKFTAHTCNKGKKIVLNV